MTDRVPPVALVIGAVASVQFGCVAGQDPVRRGRARRHRDAADAVRRGDPGAAVAARGARARRARSGCWSVAFGVCPRRDELRVLRVARPDSRSAWPSRSSSSARSGWRCSARAAPLDLVWVVLAARRHPAAGRSAAAASTAWAWRWRCSPARFWAAYILVSARMGQAIPGRLGPGAGDDRGRGAGAARSASPTAGARAARPGGARHRPGRGDPLLGRSPTRSSSRRCGACRPACSAC